MRLFVTLLLGVIIGGGLVFLLFNSMVPSAKNKEQSANSYANQTTSSASPSAAPQPTMSQQQLNKLRQQYQQQGGLPLTATVDTVYKGLGFIMRDNTGNRIFVHWTKTEPSIGQQVTVIGKPVSASNGVTQLQNQPGYTQDLGNFLQNQQFYVEALSVNTASSAPSNEAPSY